MLSTQIKIGLVLARLKRRLVMIKIPCSMAFPAIFTVRSCGFKFEVDIGFEFTEAVYRLLIKRSFF